MMLLIDSNVLIDILRGRTNEFPERMDEARQAEYDVCTSSICLHEMAFGALRSRNPERHVRLLEELLQDVGVEPWTAEDAFVAARLRAELATVGQPTGPFDLLIAAQALRLNAPLVTRNLRHFFRPGTGFDDLRLIDWTLSGQPLDRAVLIASLRRPEED